MTSKQAHGLIYDYLSGEIEPSMKAEFESLLKTDSDLRRSLTASRKLDEVLSRQPFLSASIGFTDAVLRQVGLADTRLAVVEGASHWERVVEWIQGLAPAATLATLVVLYGKQVGEETLKLYQEGTTWVDTQTGMNIFAEHPLMLLGAIVPVVAIVLLAGFGERWRTNLR